MGTPDRSPTAATATSATPTPTPSGGGAPIPTIVVQALGAVGASIGVLGFVVFCGGAITYARLKATGLPAVEGVARVPREVLLATGAEVLAPAALITFLVVAALFVIDLRLKRGGRRDLDALRDLIDRSQAELDAMLATQHKCEEQAQQAQAAALGVDPGDQPAQPTPEDDAQAERTEPREPAPYVADAIARVQLGHSLLAAAEQRLQHQRAELERREALERRQRRRGTWGRVLAGSGLLVLFELIVLFAFLTTPQLGQVLFVGLVAIATAMMAFAAFASTQQFAWFGVAAFVSIGLVFGMSRYFAAQNDPQVAPVAVLRFDRQPTAGFLVADTGDVLLLGHGRGGAAGREMIVMPRREVQDLVMGELTDPDTAGPAALLLLKHLCAQRTQDHSGRRRGWRRPPRRHLCTLRERRQVDASWRTATTQLALERHGPASG